MDCANLWKQNGKVWNNVTVWIAINPAARFQFHVFFFFFFFFLHVNSNFTWVHCAKDKIHYLHTVYILKNIKNRSYSTIYTFKNYFVTVLSVFSFQFSISVIINSVQTDSLYHTHQKGRKKMTYGFVCFWAGSKDWEWDRVQYRSFFYFEKPVQIIWLTMWRLLMPVFAFIKVWHRVMAM